MDRKDMLKDLSASDLRQELLTRLREQIRRNEEENEALKLQIRQLSPQPKTITTYRVAKPARQPRGRKRNEQPLKDIIAKAMREAGEPVRVRDLMERVRDSGYVSNANNFAAVISLTLSNNEELFERVDRGVYKLREGAGALAEQAPADIATVGMM